MSVCNCTWREEDNFVSQFFPSKYRFWGIKLGSSDLAVSAFFYLVISPTLSHILRKKKNNGSS